MGMAMLFGKLSQHCPLKQLCPGLELPPLLHELRCRARGSQPHSSVTSSTGLSLLLSLMLSASMSVFWLLVFPAYWY